MHCLQYIKRCFIFLLIILNCSFCLQMPSITANTYSSINISTVTYLEGLVWLVLGSWVPAINWEWGKGKWSCADRGRDSRKPYPCISATWQYLIRCSGSELHIAIPVWSGLLQGPSQQQEEAAAGKTLPGLHYTISSNRLKFCICSYISKPDMLGNSTFHSICKLSNGKELLYS